MMGWTVGDFHTAPRVPYGELGSGLGRAPLPCVSLSVAKRVGIPDGKHE